MIRRVGRCGLPIGNNPVQLKRRDDGGVHASGIQTCASIWACPVCAATIRNYRAQEISTGLGRHCDNGGGALLVTLTIRHRAGHRLARTVELVSEGYRALLSGRAFGRERERYGILGGIRAFEVTHGGNGWHPHLHVVLVTAGRLTERAAAEIERAWQTRWDRWLSRQGWATTEEGVGVRVDLVRRNAAAVGVYVSKVQEGKAPVKVGVASELARGDMKQARGEGRIKRGAGSVAAHRTPFQILADFGTDGAAEDLDLWHEFQEATKGRSAIRWSRGLRALLLPDVEEMTDDEITEETKGGESLGVLTSALYRAVARQPYGEAYLIAAAEAGGLDGIRRYVRSLGLSDAGVHPPEAFVNWQEIEEIRAERRGADE